MSESKDSFILYSQYLGCWWPGEDRSQGISSMESTSLLEYIVLCFQHQKD